MKALHGVLRLFLSSSLLFITVASQTSQTEIPLENPVRTAKEDLIAKLPGFEGQFKFKQYAGYLAASNSGDGKFLHYWFTKADSDKESDVLILWLNGGPGCSSISNLLRGNGHVVIDADGNVIQNKYAWNQLGDILFLDGPVGTGYSYSIKGHINSDDDSASEDYYNALMNFYEKFPNLMEKPLVLAGESYAGVYLPLLGDKILDRNPEIKLTGMVIGNGYFDAKRLGESVVFYSYYHGLLDTEDWRQISIYCCDGNSPDHKKCHFSATSIKCSEQLKALSSYILFPQPGLNPQNIYESDYNDREFASLSLSSSTIEIKTVQSKQASPNNHRNFHRVKRSSSYSESIEKYISKSLMLNSLRALSMNLTTSGLEEFPSASSTLCANHDYSIIHENYMNRDDVKLALHVPERLQKPFRQCSRDIFLSYKQIYPYQKGGMESFIRKIAEKNDKFKFTMFNGDVDLIANFIGNQWFAEELGFQQTEKYKPILIKGQRIVGFTKTFDRVKYMVLKGVGHSPIGEKPGLVYKLMLGQYN